MSISAVSSSPVRAADTAAPKPQPAPLVQARADADGDRDGSGSAGSAGHLNIKA